MALKTYNISVASEAMSPTSETDSPVMRRLVMGYFNESRSYAVWREHGTADWLLIATLAGNGRFGHPAGASLTAAGDITLVHPGARHDYGAGPDGNGWELLWAHFHPYPHWLDWLDWPAEAAGLAQLRLTDGPTRAQVTAKLREALQFTTGALARREEFAMNRLEAALLLCDAANPRHGLAAIDDRVKAAMDYLCRNYAAGLSLDQLGSRVGLSGSRLGHLFRKQVGMTPVQFMERQRLERGCQLLEFSTRPIHAIADELGFENPFYFTLRFKRLFGQSPRDYRKSRVLTSGSRPD